MAEVTGGGFATSQILVLACSSKFHGSSAPSSSEQLIKTRWETSPTEILNINLSVTCSIYLLIDTVMEIMKFKWINVSILNTACELFY